MRSRAPSSVLSEVAASSYQVLEELGCQYFFLELFPSLLNFEREKDYTDALCM